MGPYHLEQEMTLSQILFSFDGRIDRARYWPSLLPLNLIWFTGLMIDLAWGERSRTFYWMGLLAVLWPALAINVKRCHDRDRSGWFYLVAFIPIVGFWYLVEIGFLKGTGGPNRFGQDPLTRGKSQLPPAARSG